MGNTGQYIDSSWEIEGEEAGTTASQSRLIAAIHIRWSKLRSVDAQPEASSARRNLATRTFPKTLRPLKFVTARRRLDLWVTVFIPCFPARDEGAARAKVSRLT